MSILKSILYGIIQGLAEFLPVSSSGHLAIAQNIFGLDDIDDMLLFNLLLHIGTLLAVFVVYRKDILELITGFFSVCGKFFTGKFRYSLLKPNERFVLLILTATLPLAAAALLEKKVEFVSGYIKIIGVLLIINAGILFVSDRLKRGKKNIFNLYPPNALLIGVFQLIAIFPGISRSGMTITGGLVNGLDREAAVKFSFIMSVPAILGATAFKVVDVVRDDTAVFTANDYISFGAGTLTAFAAGLCAIALLRYISKKQNFTIFSAYCLIAGLTAVILG